MLAGRLPALPSPARAYSPPISTTASDDQAQLGPPPGGCGVGCDHVVDGVVDRGCRAGW